MAKPFDLRKQLKLHDNHLLRTFFADQPELRAMDWNALRSYDVEPIIAAWESLPNDRRRRLQVVLQDVHELDHDGAMRTLAEAIAWRYGDRLPAFAARRSRLDKALWAYLDAREAFDEAAIFARADALARGQFANRWNSLPKEPIAVTEKRLAALEERVRQFYWHKELRGEVCRVHHYPRANGAEYFFAYLPDWPDKLLVFDEEGNLTPREQRYAFSNVFVYLPAEGAIELIAKGGKKVQLPLRRAFCRAMLDRDVGDDEPVRPVYHLDHLLSPDFAFWAEPEDRIAAVRVRRLRLVPRVTVPAVEHLELKFRESACLDKVRAAIGRLLEACGLDRAKIRVTQASIQIHFAGDGTHASRKMTFSVGCPNTCDLRSRPDDVRVVGELCIKRWGILRD